MTRILWLDWALMTVSLANTILTYLAGAHRSTQCGEAHMGGLAGRRRFTFRRSLLHQPLSYPGLWFYAHQQQCRTMVERRLGSGSGAAAGLVCVNVVVFRLLGQSPGCIKESDSKFGSG